MNAQRSVTIVPYNHLWPQCFDQEREKLQRAFKDDIAAIYHIGSTAIPGMSAKPIIDILIEFKALKSAKRKWKKLTHLGYSLPTRNVIPHYSFFSYNRNQVPGVHLHIYECGDPQINRHVNFKDFLIAHPQMAKQYANLKLSLLEEFPHDIKNYTNGKAKLVQEIDAAAKVWPQRKKDFLPPNLDRLAADWKKSDIMKSMDANLNVLLTYYPQYLNQIELIRIPGFTWISSKLLDENCNSVLDVNVTTEETESIITKITTHFSRENIPYIWYINPYDRPSDLAMRLKRKFYYNADNNPAMYFDLDSWDGKEFIHPELEIIQATDEKTLHDFAALIADETSREALKLYYSWVAKVLTDEDPIKYYVGYIKGKPVTRGLTCYYAGVAGIHRLATAADERNRGYGKAMQYYRLKKAKEDGYHLAVLQASQQGYPIYKKIGYKECGYFREFKIPRKTTT